MTSLPAAGWPTAGWAISLPTVLPIYGSQIWRTTGNIQNSANVQDADCLRSAGAALRLQRGQTESIMLQIHSAGQMRTAICSESEDFYEYKNESGLA